MSKINSFLQPVRRRNGAAILIALVAAIPITACRSVAEPPVAPPGAAAILGANGTRTRGGITYDPAQPLDAVVTPTFDTKAPPTTGMLIYKVVFQGANGQKVPAVFTVPAGAKSAPTVLLMHGLGGSKEQMAPFGFMLASKGYASLAIDAVGHGARPKLDGKAIGSLNLTEVHTLFAETIADLGKAVDFLQTRPEVDTKRIGYMGVSMGTIMGVVFVADDTRIKTAAFWSGGGDWGKLLTTTQLPAVQAFRKSADGSLLTADAAEATLADVDPLFAVHSIAPRPLLFINGDKDTIVPPICADEMIKAAGEPKTRITLPGDHVPDIFAMASKSLSFLDQNLK